VYKTGNLSICWTWKWAWWAGLYCTYSWSLGRVVCVHLKPV